MKIYLIRHGQTEWNIQGRIQGKKDIPLNDTGRKQAGLLAEAMNTRPVNNIYCSTLKRAIDTAAAIGERQQTDVYIVEGLEEVDFGTWEGHTMEEIKQLNPVEYERWMINPVDVAPPGGENQFQAMERAVMVLKGILAQEKEDFAIVSHGATLAFLVGYMQRNHPEESEIIVSNASITTIEYNRLSEDFALVEMNDTRHLDAGAFI